jgi:transcription elongation factor GreA
MITISGLEPKRYRITPEGIQELQQQLRDLRQTRKETVSEMSDVASQTTDIAIPDEDSTVIQNQNQVAELDGQIALLERIIAMANVIERPTATDQIRIGSRITVDVDGKQSTYTLVGRIEADPSEGKISDESPLGKLLLNKKTHERLELHAPANQKTTITILDIA